MKHVLIVDDENALLKTLRAGFEAYKEEFLVDTARNGKEAIKRLAEGQFNLVVTDLKMPEIDGFELVAHIKSQYPDLPVVVMTAFGTPEIESLLHTAGTSRFLEKPIDFEELTSVILELIDPAQAGGTVTGISLPAFLQLIEMEQNTCLMEIIAPDDRQGLLYFQDGELYDAVFDQAVCEEAVLEMLGVDDVKISFRPIPGRKIKRKMKARLINLLMEGARRKDEHAESENRTLQVSTPQNIEDATPVVDNNRSEHHPDAAIPKTIAASTKGDMNMSDIQAILEKFKVVDGFQAVGAFSPNGELVAEVNGSGLKMDELGALANDVLLKAQKTTEIMDVGRGQLVHVEAPKAHVIARCLNEATDFAANSSGRAHVHMVLILANDGNVAMGKMKISSVIQELAEFFR